MPLAIAALVARKLRQRLDGEASVSNNLQTGCVIMKLEKRAAEGGEPVPRVAVRHQQHISRKAELFSSGAPIAMRLGSALMLGVVFSFMIGGTQSALAFCDASGGIVCQVKTDKDWSGAWSDYPSIHIAAGSPPPGQTPTLTFHAGANVEASTAIQIGNLQDSNATLIVDGNGTVVTTGRMGVGALNNAAGTLVVRNDGLVQVSGIFNSAFNPANTATIDVRAGGRIDVAGNAFIARVWNG
jgi:T5SS/PEP-CTERM-associated repeat protein